MLYTLLYGQKDGLHKVFDIDESNLLLAKTERQVYMMTYAAYENWVILIARSINTRRPEYDVGQCTDSSNIPLSF